MTKEEKLEKQRISSRRYYARHRERILEEAKVKNKELLEYRKEWNKQDRIKNPEKQRAVLKRSREKNYEKRLAGNREWTAKNPDKQKNIRLKSRYGITLDRYEEMLKEQNGLCMICQEELVRPYVDHCHDRHIVRGILCNLCNSGIGYFRDDVESLLRAIEYLLKD